MYSHTKVLQKMSLKYSWKSSNISLICKLTTSIESPAKSAFTHLRPDLTGQSPVTGQTNICKIKQNKEALKSTIYIQNTAENLYR